MKLDRTKLSWMMVAGLAIVGLTLWGDAPGVAVVWRPYRVPAPSLTPQRGSHQTPQTRQRLDGRPILSWGRLKHATQGSGWIQRSAPLAFQTRRPFHRHAGIAGDCEWA